MAIANIYLVPIAAVLLLTYQYIVLPAFVSPLAKIPAANWLAKVSSLWILYIRWRNIENQIVQDLHRRYGPIVRLAPNELSVNCYEDGVKTIYQGGFTKHAYYTHKFAWYNTYNMFSMTDNRQHSERKRLISHVYSKSNIYTDPTIQATAAKIVYNRLMPILTDSTSGGKPVEMLKVCWSYSMDRFTAFQFGLNHGSNFLQDKDQRDWYMGCYLSSRPYDFWIENFPQLVQFLPKLGINVVPPWPSQALSELEDWNLGKCDRAEEMLSSGTPLSIEDQPALYAHLRTTINKSAPQPVHSSPQKYPYRIDLASELFDHSAAAIETSGNTLTWLFYEMSRNPSLQTLLREELLTLETPVVLFPNGNNDDDDEQSKPEGTRNTIPNFKSLDNLPLLGAILQETLRVWIVIPGGQPRLTPHPSCSLAGYHNIPPNVKVHSAAGVLHRNPDVFPQPEIWDPYRWLNATAEQSRDMSHYFWAFSSGGRMCIGSNFAMNSMKLMIAAVYTNFTTSIVDADGIEMSEGFISGPNSEKLILQFHKVERKI